MGKAFEFRAIIQIFEDSDAAYVEIPFDVKQKFGRSRVPVVAALGGEEFESVLVKTEAFRYILSLRNDIREKINKESGDTVTVTLTEREIPCKLRRSAR